MSIGETRLHIQQAEQPPIQISTDKLERHFGSDVGSVSPSPEEWTRAGNVANQDALVALSKTGTSFERHIHEVSQARKETLTEGDTPKAQVEHKLAEQLDKITREDTHDALLKLYKRDKLPTFLAESIEEHENTGSNLVHLSIDIDYFKSYNDTFGHQFGNLALTTVSKEILTFVNDLEAQGASALGTRLGGEELAVSFLLPSDKREQIKTAFGLHDVEDENLSEALVNKLQDNVRKATNELLDSLQKELKKEDQTDVRVEMVRTLVGVAKREDEVNKEILKDEKKYTPLKNAMVRFLDTPGIDDMEPAALFTAVSEIVRRKSTEEGNTLLRRFADLLTIGSATAGSVEVKLNKPSPTVSPEDRVAISSWIDSKDFMTPTEFEMVMPGFLDGSESVQTDYKTLQEHIRTKSKEGEKDNVWARLLTRIYKMRGGRLIDLANRAEEAQKKIKRGDTNHITTTIQLMDSTTKGEEDIEKKKVVSLQYEGENGEVNEQNEKYAILVQSLVAYKKEEASGEYDPRFIPINRRQQKLRTLLLKKYPGEEGKKQVDDLLVEFHDIIEQAKDGIRRNQEVRFFDDLTKSYNELYMREVGNKEMQEAIAAGKSYSVAAIDMDNLKAINETGGHLMGDMAIMMFVKTCKDYLKKAELDKAKFIRVTGGEEFAILFPGLKSDVAKKHLDAINKEIRENIKALLSKFSTTDSDTGKKSTVFELAINYVRNKKDKNGSPGNPDHIGTVTGGIIDVQDISDNEDLHIGKLRGLAEKLGEERKNAGLKGTSGTLAELFTVA